MCQGLWRSHQQIPLLGCLSTFGKSLLHGVPYSSHCYVQFVELHKDLRGRKFTFLSGFFSLLMIISLALIMISFRKFYAFFGVTSVTFAISLVFVLLFEAPFSNLQKLLLGGNITQFKIISRKALTLNIGVLVLMGGASRGKKPIATKSVADNGKTNGHT